MASLIVGCFDPDSSLREKAFAALHERPAMSEGRNVQKESAQVFVGKSAASVSIPYSIQKADGTTLPGTIVVTFKNMGKRWDLDQVTDPMAAR